MIATVLPKKVRKHLEDWEAELEPEYPDDAKNSCIRGHDESDDGFWVWAKEMTKFETWVWPTYGDVELENIESPRTGQVRHCHSAIPDTEFNREQGFWPEDGSGERSSIELRVETLPEEMIQEIPGAEQLSEESIDYTDENFIEKLNVYLRSKGLKPVSVPSTQSPPEK